jgi:hypothetical protein
LASRTSVAGAGGAAEEESDEYEYLQLGSVHHRPVHIVLRCRLGLGRGLADMQTAALNTGERKGRDFLDAAFFYQLFDVEALAAARTFPYAFGSVKHLGEPNFASSRNHLVFAQNHLTIILTDQPL